MFPGTDADIKIRPAGVNLAVNEFEQAKAGCAAGFAHEGPSRWKNAKCTKKAFHVQTPFCAVDAKNCYKQYLRVCKEIKVRKLGYPEAGKLGRGCAG